MFSRVFRPQLLLCFHLVLICACVREAHGAPVALLNQPRANTEDQSVPLSHLQNQGPSENDILHSDHHVQHRVSHSLIHPESVSEASINSDVKPQLRDGQQHQTATGETIKNFSPTSSDESAAESMSTPDLRDGRNQRIVDPLGGKLSTEVKVQEGLNKQTSGDGTKSMQTESQDQATDSQEQIAAETKALPRNSDKSKRLSFFSVLHPALAAALSPEKREKLTDIPRPPLDNIEYSSGPLRGTESHDDDALHYPAAVKSKQSVLSEIQEVAADSHIFKATDREEHQRDVEGNLKQGGYERKFPVQAGKDLELNGREESHHPIEHHRSQESTEAEDIHLGSTGKESSGPTEEYKLGVKSVHREAMKGRDHRVELSVNRVESEHSEAQASSSEKPTSTLNATKAKEPSEAEGVMKTTAMYWNGFVSRVKGVIGALRSHKSTNQASKEHPAESFTEDDVQDMVNEVVREIQRRAEGKKVLENETDSTSDVRGDNENTEKGKGTLLMLRTKTVVSSDVVADAVTTAAKRMLSERGDSLSHDASSRLLREVQDKLEELLQPIE